jgi:hypothetical protein
MFCLFRHFVVIPFVIIRSVIIRFVIIRSVVICSVVRRFVIEPNYSTLNIFVKLFSKLTPVNLTAFIPCLTGPVDNPFASRHEGPGFNPQGSTSVKLGFSC